ncbi:MAG: hypothetical protein MMC33_009723 [Icmadophila ericetorum]|nr:hypothetical protein [Icmadophila ericetorum]
MQGFNMGRYVPPEFEGTTSANKLAGKHALGSRAKKLGQGILTVRFEMPFAIWCTTCPKPTIIGQGVRFNAEKKKVDNYYSTPIFSFRMKHVACGGWIEIRTDPKNTAYVVIEGAKKRDTGEENVQEGQMEIRTTQEKERIQKDAFAALEVKIDDRKQAVTDKSRIEELYRAKDKDWDDPYAANSKARKIFRAERHTREKNNLLTEGLKDRMSLGIDLLEETEEDRRRAGFVEFGDFGQDASETAIIKAQSKPLFAALDARKPTEKSRLVEKKSHKKKTKKSSVPDTAALKEKLWQELRGNTRAIIDPFLGNQTAPVSTMIIIPGIKRKRSPALDDKAEQADTQDIEVVKPLPLVDYDSD